jgi:hypothetical protein
MGHLTPEQKEAARKELAMYLGAPPYDVEDARRLVASGLLDARSRKAYGMAPLELIREISDIVLTEPQRQEALRSLTRRFGKPPVSEEAIRRRASSAMLQMRILARYLMPLEELMHEVGFKTKRPRRGRAVKHTT